MGAADQGAAAPKEAAADKPTIEPSPSILLEAPVSSASLETVERNARATIAASPNKDGRPWMWLVFAAVLAIIVALIAWLVG